MVQIVPSLLPKSVRDQADEYRKALAAAEQDAAGGPRPHARVRAPAARRRPQEHEGRARRAAAPAQGRRQGAPRRGPDRARVEAELLELYRRVGEVIHVRPTTIHERVIRGIADAPYSNVTVRTDVPLEQFNFMRERPEYFPGVVVTKRYLRRYPHGETAAQLFGTVSEITDEQLTMRRVQGDRAGHADRPERARGALRQVPARRRRLLARVVDAFGAATSSARSRSRDPKQGQRLKLTIDFDLQKAGDAALEQAIRNSEYQTQRRRVDRDGPARRRDPRHGLQARASTPACSRSRSRRRPTTS